MNTMNDDAINPLMIDTSQTNLSFSDYLDEKLVNKVHINPTNFRIIMQTKQFLFVCLITKGSSLMRMANYMLGVDAFSNGTVVGFLFYFKFFLFFENLFTSLF